MFVIHDGFTTTRLDDTIEKLLRLFAGKWVNVFNLLELLWRPTWLLRDPEKEPIEELDILLGFGCFRPDVGELEEGIEEARFFHRRRLGTTSV